MKIYNEDLTKEIQEQDIDYSKYKLVEAKRFIKHHEAVKEVKEQYHYETIREYTNGGKDVKKVIDVESVEPKEAYDEYEDVLKIEPLSAEELNQIEMQQLKNWYDNYYAQHEQKYRRLHSLGKLTDEGRDPYSELINLYNEAEIKRARIQELERLLSDNSK